MRTKLIVLSIFSLCVSILEGQILTTQQDINSATCKLVGPQSLCIDRKGNTIYADRTDHTIKIFEQGKGLRILAGQSGRRGDAIGPGHLALFNEPWGICEDIDGSILVSDTKNHRIKKILMDSEDVIHYAGTGSPGYAIGTIEEASFYEPTDLMVAPDSSLIIVDHLSHTIKRIDVKKGVSILSGRANKPGDQDGLYGESLLNRPNSLFVSAQGVIYFSDEWNHKIKQILPSGETQTLAGSGITGHLDGQGPTAQFNFPWGLYVNDNHEVFVTDGLNHVVRKIDSTGFVSTIIGTPGMSGFQDGIGSETKLNGATDIMWHDGGFLICDLYNARIRILDINPENKQFLLNMNLGDEFCFGSSLDFQIIPFNHKENKYTLFLNEEAIAIERNIATIKAETAGINTLYLEVNGPQTSITSNAISFVVRSSHDLNVEILREASNSSYLNIAPPWGAGVEWNTMETGPKIYVREPGLYWANFVDTFGCEFTSDTFEVKIEHLENTGTRIRISVYTPGQNQVLSVEDPLEEVKGIRLYSSLGQELLYKESKPLVIYRTDIINYMAFGRAYYCLVFKKEDSNKPPICGPIILL